VKGPTTTAKGSIPDLTLVILAAGIASRYGRLKQLEPVGPGGEALMDYAVFDAARAEFTKVVVVVRPEIRDAVQSHIESLVRGALNVVFVSQMLDDLPPGFKIPTNRSKPWGTAHAVLGAERELQGAFAVSNADDFYGAEAYRDLARHLRIALGTCALVGFRLDRTLSESGGVSRAICGRDGDGFLTTISETRNIIQTGSGIVGTDVTGKSCILRGSDTVSMNLWGFTPAILPATRTLFSEFLSQNAQNPFAEFLIPDVVAHLVATGKTRVRILDSETTWMGVTFPNDRDLVVRGIRKLIDRQVYPARLAAWFKRQS
jgi:hypothetical protein